ncbi:hypothetical protein [Dietzia alimentaria]|uniref:hypothetical protein n=1 Tax=Dietzia alimentaria TaxID=665550 RepID=UPI000299D2EF|nr:hypothetical protein [Dietzia alimentaria]
MTDPRREIAAGLVTERVVALVLAALLGGYGMLLLGHGEDLWSLRTYGPALSVPGGVVTWMVAAFVSALLLVVGTITRRERVVGAGATIAGVWLSIFAAMFGIAALDSGEAVALPGVLVYACAAFLAAARAATAVGRH